MFYKKYEAEEQVAVKGNCTIVKDNPDYIIRETGACLTGYSGSGFVDMGADVTDISSSEHSLPSNRDMASWTVEVPKTGKYRLNFVYNNPATKWGGDKNIRDERYLKIKINGGDDPAGKQGMVGRLIFSVSGYNNPSFTQSVKQTKETVSGNTRWNNCAINVVLNEGVNKIELIVDATPGQAIYAGPNIDYFEVSSIEDEFLPEEEVPHKELPFVHPGIFYTEQDLMKIKEHLSHREPVWIKRFDYLRNSRFANKEYQMQGPFKIVERGPYNDPDVGATEFMNDAKAAHYNALMWYFTGDSRHAAKAMEILDAWACTLKDFVNNDAKLNVAMHAPKMVNAAELLKHVYNKSGITQNGQWPQESIAQFDRLVRTIFYENELMDFHPRANGNWDALITSANMAFSVYLDDIHMFNRALRQMVIGDVIKGTLSRGAVCSYIYESGETQETSRDQNHVDMGLEGNGYSMEIAYNQEMDLFGLYGHRLLTGAEYFARYNLGQDVDSVTFPSDFERGNVTRPVYDILINYYGKHCKENRDIQVLRQLVDERVHLEDREDAWIQALMFSD